MALCLSPELPRSTSLLLALSACLLFLHFSPTAYAHQIITPKIGDASQNSSGGGAHGELTGHGFPIGLLPDTVVTYELDSESGFFKVALDSECRFLIPGEQYPVAYAPAISGVLSYEYIKDLKGVSVKAFYKWWTITGIRASNGDLIFEVGMLNVNYPASNFDESPICDVNRGKASRSSS